MKLKKIIFGVIGVIVVLGVIGAILPDDEKTSSSDVKKEQVKLPGIGETVKDTYFDVTVNGAEIVKSKKINSFESLKAEPDIKYLIINITFKNTDKESRMVTDGSVIVNYDGKNYEFDKTETVMDDGWGLFLDQLNPLTKKTTNLVYRLPAEIKGNAIYKTGRGNAKIELGIIK